MVATNVGDQSVMMTIQRKLIVVIDVVVEHLFETFQNIPLR